MDVASLSDEALVRDLARSADAFVVLYRRYEQPVLAYFRRRTGDAELAADLTGEVFARALEGLRAGRELDGPFSAWLFGIARHVLVDSYRRGRVDDESRLRLAMEPIALTDQALERIDRLGEEDVIRQALADLPEPSARRWWPGSSASTATTTSPACSNARRSWSASGSVAGSRRCARA